MGKPIAFTKDECDRFPGRWSVWPDQMWAALNALPDGLINVVEFGAGRGTEVLAELLQEKGRLGYFVSYENNVRYLSTSPLVKSVVYEKFPEWLDLPSPAQLVIIDGPNGKDREKWYPLLVPHVQPGTIVVIDDIDHYREFEDALNGWLVYQLVEHVNLGKPKGSGCIVCWKTVRIIE